MKYTIPFSKIILTKSSRDALSNKLEMIKRCDAIKKSGVEKYVERV